MNLNILKSLSARKRAAATGSVSSQEQTQRPTMAALLERARRSSGESLVMSGGGSVRTADYLPSVSSIEELKDPSIATSENKEELLSVVVLDPATLGQTLCGGNIGSLGTVCIKPAQ